MMEKFARLSTGCHVFFSGVYCVLWITACLQCAFVIQHFIPGAGATEQPELSHSTLHSTAQLQQYPVQRDSIDRELLQEDGERSSDEEVEAWVEGDKFFTKSPYLLGSIPIKDWDQQRRDWLDDNPHMKTTEAGKPSVLLISGSQASPCSNAGGDHFHLKALKNKVDYARMHNFEIFHNFWFLDPKFTGVWAKLPVVRSLMLSHPETEWMMWMDVDAIFTDMLFELPFHSYDGYDMVIWSWMDGLEKKDWVAVNDGIFLLRNCQWSLDLLDKWSPLGPQGKIRDEAGKFLSSFLTNRRPNFPADDQSALMYLLLTDKLVLDKVKFVEKEYKLHSYWVDVVPHYEKFMARYYPGLGDCRWPFVTHFTGCSPCSGGNDPNYSREMCWENFQRAFYFADNQVMAYMGYQHRDLSSPELVRIWNETSQPLVYVGVNPWSARIAAGGSGHPDDCYNF